MARQRWRALFRETERGCDVSTKKRRWAARLQSAEAPVKPSGNTPRDVKGIEAVETALAATLQANFAAFRLARSQTERVHAVPGARSAPARRDALSLFIIT